jgi:four helix bundle protein
MENLKILQKTEEMISYAYTALKQFPKAEKHVLSAEIRNTMFKIVGLIITTNKKYYKKTTLQELDVELEKLKYYIRLSKNLGFLDIKKYETWSKKNIEIGKMIGGWMKSISQ